jgi:hypothetical protein
MGVDGVKDFRVVEVRLCEKLLLGTRVVVDHLDVEYIGRAT